MEIHVPLIIPDGVEIEKYLVFDKSDRTRKHLTKARRDDLVLLADGIISIECCKVTYGRKEVHCIAVRMPLSPPLHLAVTFQEFISAVYGCLNENKDKIKLDATTLI